MKTILVLGLLTVATSSFALRCGNSLITKGDQLYQVEQACQISNSYDVGGPMASGDVKYRFVKEGNFTHKLVFIDGVLNTIDDER